MLLHAEEDLGKLKVSSRMVAIIKPTFVQHEDDSPKQRPLSILTAQISPDGQRLATGGMDQKIKIWSTGPIMDADKEADPNEKKLLSTLASHNGQSAPDAVSQAAR